MAFNEEEMRSFGKIIGELVNGRNLTREACAEAYRQVICNTQPELQQGAFLAAHLAKKATLEELCGVWDALYKYDTATIRPDFPDECCDIVGTGSDALKTINVSTPASFLAAACGVKVAKKGARLVTGVSGATDILEIMGLDIATPLSRARKCLETHGICYLPGEAFLQAGWGRLIKSMRFTSTFNIIGPLTRPCARTTSIVIGAYAPELCPQLIEVLRGTGTKAAMSPYGMSSRHDPSLGIDEVSVCGPTVITELRHDRVETYTLTPADFGIREHPFAAIASKRNARENVEAILAVLKGRDDTPVADMFCVNAACALRVSGKEDDLKKGTELARQTIADGTALEKLKQLVGFQGHDRGLETLDRLLGQQN